MSTFTRWNPGKHAALYANISHTSLSSCALFYLFILYSYVAASSPKKCMYEIKKEAAAVAHIMNSQRRAE